jgi:hypothetical protein
LNHSTSHPKPPASLSTCKHLYIDMRTNSTMLTIWKRISYSYAYSPESSFSSCTSSSSHASRPAVGLRHHVPGPRPVRARARARARAQAGFPGALMTTSVARHHLTQNIQITTRGPGRLRRCGAIKTVSDFGVGPRSAVLELTSWPVSATLGQSQGDMTGKTTVSVTLRDAIPTTKRQERAARSPHHSSRGVITEQVPRTLGL